MAAANERGSEQEWPWSEKPGYRARMLGIYQQVVARPNYMAACIQLPSNLVFEECECIVDITGDNRVVDFLRYGFPARYMGPAPTPSSANHPSVNCQLQDLAEYIVKELGHGATLGPFLAPPFQPWCQVNPLFTSPRKTALIGGLLWICPGPTHRSARRWGHPKGHASRPV